MFLAHFPVTQIKRWIDISLVSIHSMILAHFPVTYWTLYWPERGNYMKKCLSAPIIFFSFPLFSGSKIIPIIFFTSPYIPDRRLSRLIFFAFSPLRKKSHSLNLPCGMPSSAWHYWHYRTNNPPLPVPMYYLPTSKCPSDSSRRSPMELKRSILNSASRHLK